MAEIRQYIDLNLELRDLDQDAGTFKVAVLPSAKVGSTPAVTVNYAYDEISWMLDDLDRKQLAIEDVVALGKALTDRLLPEGPVRDLFRQAGVVAGQDGGVRIRLIIHEPILAQLPWEFAYDPRRLDKTSRDFFLVLAPRMSMVRDESLPEPPGELAAADPQNLRMLVATANAQVPGQRPLKLDQERKVIESALKDFDVEGVSIDLLPVIENATVDALRKALARKADLFHYAGHGTFDFKDVDPQTGEPVGEGAIALVQDGQSLKPDLLPARELGPLLAAAGVRLAVLGACKTGRRDRVSPWAGVAPALLEKGVPAAVAMQYLVDDNAAIAFSQAFYTAVAAGLTLDEAVWTGRQAMLRIPAPGPELNVEWGVPVLYMRSPDGVIFPTLAERPSETRRTLRLKERQVIEVIEAGGEVLGQEVDLSEAPQDADIVVEGEQQVDTVKGKLVGQKISFGKKP